MGSSTSRVRKWTLIAAVAILLAVLVGTVLMVEMVLPRMFVVPSRTHYNPAAPGDTPLKENLAFTAFDTRTSDGLTLKCWFVPASPQPVELRHLRNFIVVADELSFTKAAQKLRLAQPSLTRQVRNLEDEIGVRLLNRAHNRINLTGEGRAFLFDAKKLLAMCAESVATVQRMQRGESSQLNIGYVANIHYALLPATLGAFRKLCQSVALNLFDMRSDEQFQALDSRRIDHRVARRQSVEAAPGLHSDREGSCAQHVSAGPGVCKCKRAQDHVKECAGDGS